MDVAASLAGAIRRATSDWDDLTIERAVFGTTDPAAIAQMVVEFVPPHLAAAVSGCLFYESSMGCVFGLSLDDGRSVLLKGQPPNLRVDRLAAAQRVQAHLADRGYPAPRPILSPTALAQGHVTAEEWLATGEYRDPHRPEIRSALATLLADIARLGGELREAGLRRTSLGKHEGGRLWGTPHSSLFDFEATSRGAEWIDALAAQAQPLLWNPAGDDAVGHADWQARHVRFDGARPSAVYDWDSLVHDTEAIIVGHAAHAFTMQWLLPVPVAPSLDEARAFVASYEQARGRRFTGDERRTLAAALTYSMAYTARCEHSRDPDADPPPPGSYRSELRTGGEAWLATW